MAVKDILILGDNRLYDRSREVESCELQAVEGIVADLHDTMMDFRRKYNAGRAIASPQIGEFKRIIYMNIGKPVVFINPVIEYEEDECFEVWDDCMSFPGLKVRVKRHKKCSIYYKNMNWEDCKMELEGDLSELLQHEYDHLNGILAVQRAIDNKSLKLEL